MFKKAERRKARLKIALTGPSGAGKTYSALQLATGLGKKIAVIDTENESASLYADRFDFDTLNIDPPFTIKKYTDAMKAAQDAGYDVLIIDSLSHAWAGEGGILERKSAKDNQGGNSYTNWAQFTKEHEAFKSALLYADIHIIGNMRSKQDYVMEQNDRGKSAPKKVGLAPIQREGMEYEFTVVFDIAMDHNFHVSKDRTGLFDGRIEKMEPKHGAELIAWLSGAAAPEAKPALRNYAPKAPVEDDDESLDPEILGDYRLTFGTAKGERLADHPIKKWTGYLETLESTAEKEGKELGGGALSFKNALLKYIKAKERETETV